VPLVQKGSVSSDVGIYMNRLSDYLFTAARLAVQTRVKVLACYIVLVDVCTAYARPKETCRSCTGQTCGKGGSHLQEGIVPVQLLVSMYRVCKTRSYLRLALGRETAQEILGRLGTSREEGLGEFQVAVLMGQSWGDIPHHFGPLLLLA
jgi:hypothetical protein